MSCVACYIMCVVCYVMLCVGICYDFPNTPMFECNGSPFVKKLANGALCVVESTSFNEFNVRDLIWPMVSVIRHRKTILSTSLVLSLTTV